jgi:hypothetical protein
MNQWINRAARLHFYGTGTGVAGKAPKYRMA